MLLPLTCESASRCSSVVRIPPVRSSLLYTNRPLHSKSAQKETKDTGRHKKLKRESEITKIQ